MYRASSVNMKYFISPTGVALVRGIFQRIHFFGKGDK
jgi:hypothetical protein